MLVSDALAALFSVGWACRWAAAVRPWWCSGPDVVGRRLAGWLVDGRRTEPLPVRPAVVVAVCVAAGCVLAWLLDPSPGVGGAIAWWCVAATALLAWGLAGRIGRPTVALVALLVALAATAAAWAEAHADLFSRHDLAWHLDESPTPVAVKAVIIEGFRVVGARGERPGSAAVEPASECVVRIVARRAGSRWRPATGRATVTVVGTPPPLEVGDQVRILGRGLRPTAALNPGEFDQRQRARADRCLSIIRVGSPRGLKVIEATGRSGLVRWIDHVRDRGVATLGRHLAPERAAVAAALLLGSRESLSREDADDFLATGTVHILSISGLHVGLLSLALFRILRVLAVPRAGGLLAVAVCTGAYMLLVRAETPVLRATLLVWLSCLAAAAGRRSPAVNALAVSGVVVLAVRPGDVLAPGAQLSFLSTAVLVGLAAALPSRRLPADPIDRLIERSRSRLERLARAVAWHCWVGFVVGAAVWVATLPIVAARFHVVSPVGLVANVLVAPLVAVAMACGACCLLAATLSTTLAAICGAACDATLAAMVAIVRLAAAVPGGHWWVAGPPGWWVAGWYACCAATLVWFRREALCRPGTWAAVTAAWVAVLVVSEGVAGAAARPAGLRGVVAAVGHGCGVVLTTPAGRTLVCDAGRMGAPGAACRSLAAVLWSGRTRSIDHLVISHADVDHLNAVPGLLERFTVGEVVVAAPLLASPAAAVRDLLPRIRSRGIPLRVVRAGDSFAVDPQCRVRVLHPAVTVADGASDNESSLVLAVEAAGRRWLLTGDLEGRALERFVAAGPDSCDVLVAPHHGSLTSLPPDVAAATRPAVVVVSGAESRSWPTVHAAYARAVGGADVLRTGRDGAVAVEADAGALVVSRFSGGRWRPVR
ncbi:MAG: ComEC/Rec2 family competence protein [Planctomycetaceae bacterium]